MVRRLIISAAVAAALVGVYFFGGRYLWPPPDRSHINVVGMIEAQEVNVTSRIAGRISRLDLLEGDRVERGQVICWIEDVDLRNSLAKARGDLMNAQANLAAARRDYDRYRQLYAEEVIATKTRDDARTAVETDAAAVASAQAQVSYYQDQLADTEIRAPIDGVVVDKALEVGEWVTPGTPIVTVDDLSTIWARVDVQETDLAALYVGKPALVSLPGNPPTVLQGQIMSIGQEGQFATERDVRRGRQDIRTFYVKVRILQNTGEAKPGMTAEVSFAIGTGGAVAPDQDQHGPRFSQY